MGRKQSDGVLFPEFTPRFSTGYFPAINRPTVLVETHVLKPYNQRVPAVYSLLLRTLEHVGPDLKTAVQQSDVGPKPGEEIVLTTQADPAPATVQFHGYDYQPYSSAITGANISHWDHNAPFTLVVPAVYQRAPAAKTTVPAAYIVPRAWAAVIERLDIHGIRYQKTKRALKSEFSTWRLDEPRWGGGPYEGRQQPSFRAIEITESREIPAGSAIVPVDQPKGRLVIHLLDPTAPDSLLKWGFFNAVFESKEYAADYAMEPFAQKMLATDPQLRQQFEEKLQDEAFAKSPGARLDWFYQRSPYYDKALNKYPVVKLSPQELTAL